MQITTFTGMNFRRYYHTTEVIYNLFCPNYIIQQFNLEEDYAVNSIWHSNTIYIYICRQVRLLSTNSVLILHIYDIKKLLSDLILASVTRVQTAMIHIASQGTTSPQPNRLTTTSQDIKRYIHHNQPRHQYIQLPQLLTVPAD